MTKQKRTSEDRVRTGVRNLDALLNGGIPRLSVTLVGGTPGAGKTILSEQICFQNATPDCPALMIQTLSEPTAKTLRYLKQFKFFDPQKLEDGSVHFVDLGGILRSKGLAEASARLLEQIKRVKPAFVVIDSFKVFGDLASSNEDIRKFAYETAITLMSWECTSFLLGEFSPAELEGTPLSSIVDGILILSSESRSGEQQRFLQVMKMRGTSHDRDEHPFSISDKGIEVYASKLEIQPEVNAGTRSGARTHRKTGIAKFDALVGKGIPGGASILISGATGTGKTVFCLETVFRGAVEANEKGLYFSFEETPEQLLANAHSLGWDLEREIKRGMVRIVYVSQSDVLVERDLLMMRDAIASFRAKRVAIDSISAFLHKVGDQRKVREKVSQLCALIQGADALGLFCTDVPFGSGQISAFGVEEAIVDGVILLTSTEFGMNRERYLEVYKLRDTEHQTGRHRMTIEHGGMSVHPPKPRTKGKKR